MKSGRAGLYEIPVQVALLTAQGGAHSEEALDEAAALFAVAAEAALAHEHGEADGALGGVVRRLDALVVEEGKGLDQINMISFVEPLVEQRCSSGVGDFGRA